MSNMKGTSQSKKKKLQQNNPTPDYNINIWCLIILVIRGGKISQPDKETEKSITQTVCEYVLNHNK